MCIPRRRYHSSTHFSGQKSRKTQYPGSLHSCSRETHRVFCEFSVVCLARACLAWQTIGFHTKMANIKQRVSHLCGEERRPKAQREQCRAKIEHFPAVIRECHPSQRFQCAPWYLYSRACLGKWLQCDSSGNGK
jgi:hypothetical protein